MSDHLTDNPTIDPVNLLHEDREAQYRWRNQWSDTRMRLGEALGDFGLVEFHKAKLGPEDYCLEPEQEDHVRNWVWERDGYRIYVNEQGIFFQVAFGTEPQAIFDSLEMYQEAMGVCPDPIPRSERLRFEEIGRKAAEGKEYQLSRMPKDDLKAFVLGWCDGQVFTDKHCRPQDAGMVFMPLVFGALSPQEPKEAEGDRPAFEGEPAWHALQTLPSPGPEPGLKDQPRHPGYPDEPEEPELAPGVEPDQKRLDDIEFNIRWENIPASARKDYLGSIQAENDRIQAANDELLAQWEQAKAAHAAECERIDEQHQEALAQWQRDNDGLEARHEEWERERARANAAYGAFMQQWAKDVGLIWEWYDQALGGRSINGNPIFYSLRIMHRKDWEIARKAITRELERRKAFDIDIEEDTDGPESETS